MLTYSRNQNRQNRQSASPSRGTGQSTNGELYKSIRDRIQQRLLSEIELSDLQGDRDEMRVVLERMFLDVVAEVDMPISRSERNDLFERVVADILGLGPLEPLLRDDSVTEVLVNGPDHIFVERNGVLERSRVRFQDDAEVMRVVERIVAPFGRRIDDSSPMVDARLPDGSRVNVIIPPLSLVGPCLSIRKFAKDAMSVDDIVAMGTMTREMAEFLRSCVRAALNIVVSGGTSTGKTTFLNMLSSFIPNKERIITIEDAAELQLQQEHVVRLESRPANVEGRGQVAIRQLVVNALRMRPDRIVVGEVRGGEALDMLQAMNTGHEGSLTTVHANTSRDTLHRVETMVLMAGMELPLRAIREQIASAFDLVIQLERLSDGTRRVTQVSEVQGLEGDIIVMQDIFRFRQTGVIDGRVQGQMEPTGVRPKFSERLESHGEHISPTVFMRENQRNGRW